MQQARHTTSEVLHIKYSPYFGSRNSSIRYCTDSAEGRTKHMQRRCRIFSRFKLSRRLFALSELLSGGDLNVTLLNEVDFMIEECRLRSGCRDYRNLTEVNSDLGSPQYRRLALSHCQAEVSSFLRMQLLA